jgi:hydroxymethylbilane synthase
MAQSSTVLRIGSRSSPLALAQAQQVRDALARAHGFEASAIAIHPIRTTGDMVQDRALAEIGGKALFTKEIEQALADGAIDLAVHSAKDMATMLPAGLMLAACLPREDPRDVFISRKADGLAALPTGARVATASLRRQAMVRRLRSDLAVVAVRGNVETRLRKLEMGVAEALVLAFAGLKRLGLEKVATAVFDVDMFPPAVGQGAIAIEARADDRRVLDLLAAIDHAETTEAVRAERAFLAELDGSCRTPIAGHAVITGESVRFRGLVLRPDGSEAFEATRVGDRRKAMELGADAGRELRHRAGAASFVYGA